MKTTDKHIIFWGGPFSNLFPYDTGESEAKAFGSIRIRVNGKEFPTSEHAFQWLKSDYFGDSGTCKEIQQTDRPEQARQLGKSVLGFVREDWDEACMDCMFKAVFSKFSQNEKLKGYILRKSFDGKKFVYACPYDRFWGVGLRPINYDADDETKWNGANKLGQVLDQVRKKLTDETNEQ